MASSSWLMTSDLKKMYVTILITLWEARFIARGRRLSFFSSPSFLSLTLAPVFFDHLVPSLPCSVFHCYNSLPLVVSLQQKRHNPSVKCKSHRL